MSVEELDACYVVRNSGGRKLSYVYFEDEPGRRIGRQAASALHTALSVEGKASKAIAQALSAQFVTVPASSSSYGLSACTVARV